MTTVKAKFKLQRCAHLVHHECFFNLLNSTAKNAGLSGRCGIRNYDVYIFELEGPDSAIRKFMDFLHFTNGSLATIKEVSYEQAVAVRQPPRNNPEQ